MILYDLIVKYDHLISSCLGRSRQKKKRRDDRDDRSRKERGDKEPSKNKDKDTHGKKKPKKGDKKASDAKVWFYNEVYVVKLKLLRYENWFMNVRIIRISIFFGK